jgi:hypothetical protein
MRCGGDVVQLEERRPGARLLAVDVPGRAGDLPGDQRVVERLLDLNGSMDPSLATYRSEARHYSGRMTEPEWGCPFTARPTA